MRHLKISAAPLLLSALVLSALCVHAESELHVFTPGVDGSDLETGWTIVSDTAGNLAAGYLSDRWFAHGYDRNQTPSTIAPPLRQR